MVTETNILDNHIEAVNNNLNPLVVDIMVKLDMDPADIEYMHELSPYLILDGHRSGMQQNENPAQGYLEGAIFSLRFAKIMQELGGRQCSFLIHTLRNYATMDRMKAIFDAITNVGKKFIATARESGIQLKYFGESVHTTYAMADIINTAERMTLNCTDFNLNFLTNYSDDWAIQNLEKLEKLPEISVIGRFTKGHYSGASIPTKANKANFTYIQQASISDNWTNEELITLALSLLKSHLSLKGFVGGKSYANDEKTQIYLAREVDMQNNIYQLKGENHKRIITFNPMGPITIEF